MTAGDCGKRAVFGTAATVLMGLVLVCVSPAAAQQPSGWSLGVGAVASGEPYGEADTRVTPVPVLGYEGERFFLRGFAAGWRLPRVGSFRSALVVRARMQSFDADDDPVLEGMDSRRRTAEGGLRVGGGKRWLRGHVGVYQELLGRYHGQVVEARLQAPVPMGHWVLVPSVGVDWHSSETADYYYGVGADEAKSDRPAYAPGASLNRVVGLGLRYRGGERFRFVLNVNRAFFDSSVRASPIVERDGRWSGFAGVSWRL